MSVFYKGTVLQNIFWPCNLGRHTHISLSLSVRVRLGNGWVGFNAYAVIREWSSIIETGGAPGTQFFLQNSSSGQTDIDFSKWN